MNDNGYVTYCIFRRLKFTLGLVFSRDFVQVHRQNGETVWWVVYDNIIYISFSKTHLKYYSGLPF